MCFSNNLLVPRELVSWLDIGCSGSHVDLGGLYMVHYLVSAVHLLVTL